MTAMETSPIAVELIAEAGEGADLKTGEVIAEAFRMSGCYCPNCNYPQNAQKYEQLLWRYISAQRERHRWQQRHDAVDGYRFAHLSLTTADTIRGLNNALVVVDRLKTEMKPYRPCARCRVRFNPTSRVRHGMKRFPFIQEFIND